MLLGSGPIYGRRIVLQWQFAKHHGYAKSSSYIPKHMRSIRAFVSCILISCISSISDIALSLSAPLYSNRDVLRIQSRLWIQDHGHKWKDAKQQDDATSQSAPTVIKNHVCMTFRMSALLRDQAMINDTMRAANIALLRIALHAPILVKLLVASARVRPVGFASVLNSSTCL